MSPLLHLANIFRVLLDDTNPDPSFAASLVEIALAKAHFLGRRVIGHRLEGLNRLSMTQVTVYTLVEWCGSLV